MSTPEHLHPDLKILRLTLMRELETINQYQDFFDEAENPAVKELMGHLMFEEKEHVAELTEMLKRFDPDQLSHFEGTHAAEIGRAEAANLDGHVAILPGGPGDQAGEALSNDPDPEGTEAHAWARTRSPAPLAPEPPAPVQADSPPLVVEVHQPVPVPPTGPISAISAFTVGSLLGQAQP